MHENRRWERWKPYILLKWYLIVFVAVNLLIQVLPWTTIVWHGHLGSDLMACFLRHRIACSSVHMASFFTTLVPRIRTKEVVKLMETPGNSWKNRYILSFCDFHVSLFYSIVSFLCFLSILIIALHSIIYNLVCILANFRIAWLPDTTSSCYACPLEFSFLSLHLHGCGALIRMLKGSRGHVEWHIVTS